MRYVLHDDSFWTSSIASKLFLTWSIVHSTIPSLWLRKNISPDLQYRSLSAYRLLIIPSFPLISARSPILPILSTLGAPQIITFPDLSAHPFFFTHSISLSRLQRRGIQDVLGVEIEFDKGEVELEGVDEEEVEECGIPEERAEGELVWGTSLSLSLSFVAPIVASRSRSSSSMDLIPALEARGGRRSSTSDYISVSFLWSPIPLVSSFSSDHLEDKCDKIVPQIHRLHEYIAFHVIGLTASSGTGLTKSSCFTAAIEYV